MCKAHDYYIEFCKKKDIKSVDYGVFRRMMKNYVQIECMRRVFWGHFLGFRAQKSKKNWRLDPKTSLNAKTFSRSAKIRHIIKAA